jgi:hypothetical protein
LVEEKDEMVAAQLQRAAASDAANIGRSGAGQQLGFMVGANGGNLRNQIGEVEM